MGENNTLLIFAAVALALFVFMQFRSTKKRRVEAETLKEKMVPGAEIMTNYGLFGTLLSIDDESNEALIETTPGTILRIHRQTLLKVVEDDNTVATESAAEAQTGTPEFGQRLDDAPDAPRTHEDGKE